jgi:DNA-binding NarL/FixJ family response regulator/anti-sigma regulatory factor (Ser/Thr protein kinase)
MAPHSEITLEVHDGVLEGPLGERGRQLLRIVGEALTNVRRHSGAKNVGVGLGITEEKLWAEVSDDGVGFDAARQQEQREEQDSEEALSAPGGLGLRGMVERARALGGGLTIESDPHSGTMVRFEMPLGTTTRVPEEPAGAAAGGGEPEEQELEAAAAVRVLLVEDHAAVREALASSFQREQGFEVVAEASTLEQAREKMLDEIEVAVIDLGLPDGYGGDLIKDLRDANPRAQALVLSASLERGEIARAVEAGAAAVLSKTAHLDEVVGAIKRLRAGEPLMTLEEVVELLRFAGSRREEELEARRSVEKLTAREVEVLQALAEGFGNEQIAQRLHISLRTERNHMANILSKLGVHSQLQALVFALRHGVVEVR